jgi:hypothetical protein
MESPLSLLRPHWDLEPEICKSFEIKPSVFRFMESFVVAQRSSYLPVLESQAIPQN